MDPIKILHNIPTIGKTSFGIGQISNSLAQAQFALKNDVTIWCLDNSENIQWASQTHGFPLERIKGFQIFGPKNLWFSPDMIRCAGNTGQGIFDVVHQHGIWTGSSNATLVFSKKRKIPTVIAPHGSFNPSGLNLSSWKKKIALSFYERENLQLAACLHASSEREITDIRNFGLINPIAYIPNGIHQQYLSMEGNSKRFREEFGITPGKKVLLFLARIAPLKGLPMLIEAINSIHDAFSGWQLIIAGIDEANHKKDVELLIKYLHLEEQIKIIGPLFNESKNDAFAAAELFILPSHSEGAPMVVLDSLAAGVPVITTKASTWPDLEEYKCGWWTEINTAAIANALKEAISLPTEKLSGMGQNGKALISEKYVWQKLALNTIQLYNWLLKKEDKPEFVTLN